jgi:chemotaxis signal transduction protein
MSVALDSKSHRRRDPRPEQMILFSVARQTFLIAAEAVKEIRSTDGLAGSVVEFENSQVPKVRHLMPQGQRCRYVVSGCAHFHLPTTRPTLVLMLRQFRAAVLVDSVERMAEIPAVYPLPRAYSGEERIWYRGLAYLEEHIIPVIQPGGFLTREQFERLDAAAGAIRAEAQAEGPVHA